VRVTGYLTAADSGGDLVSALGSLFVSGSMFAVEELSADIFYAWSEKQAQIDAVLSLTSAIDAASSKGLTAEFLAESDSSVGCLYLTERTRIGTITASEILGCQVVVEKFMDCELELIAVIATQFYLFIEGTEKFAVYQDVRRRSHDFDCIIPKKVR
jgi:hypothetical protein